ncbi:hypothetical protein KOM00_18565 [Geomonas sp. Red69]|uniref:hypothetical protein n=1 Tax=Geomonas diazotrophica TaxID=2843197 RepID=UPI001C115211|nr:hypothetical protein [Geomonas diazotrophica]MBU5638732.1 hypothetical protein [Geomonas diazotrophica]
MRIEPETELGARVGVAAAGPSGLRMIGRLMQRLPLLEPLSYLAAEERAMPPVDLVVVVSGMDDVTVAGDTLRAATVARGLSSVRLCVAVVPRSSLASTPEVLGTLREVGQLVDALFLVSHRNLKPLYPDAPRMMAELALEEFLSTTMIEDLTRIITERGLICIDFADVVAILRDGSSETCLGVGLAGGKGGAALAAEKAVQSIREQGGEPSQHGAFLVCVKGSTNITMDDFDDASRVVHENVHPDANIIIGLLLDDDLGSNVRVLIMAKKDAVPVAPVVDERVRRFLGQT